MAKYRPTPKCPYCGEPIAKGIYKDQSKVPPMFRLIGDTFLRWETIPHECEGTIKHEQEIKDWQNKPEIKKLLGSFNEELKSKKGKNKTK